MKNYMLYRRDNSATWEDWAKGKPLILMRYNSDTYGLDVHGSTFGTAVAENHSFVGNMRPITSDELTTEELLCASGFFIQMLKEKIVGEIN